MQHNDDHPSVPHPQPPPPVHPHLTPFDTPLVPIDEFITPPDAQPLLQQGDLFSESITDPVSRLLQPSSLSRPHSPLQSTNAFDLIPGIVTIHARPITPENDDDYLQDEPSSVLASKIISAHDNPSPPPSPPIPDPLSDVPLIDFSSPASHTIPDIQRQPPPPTPPYSLSQSNAQNLLEPVSPTPLSAARPDFLPPTPAFERLNHIAQEDADSAFTVTDTSLLDKAGDSTGKYPPFQEPELSGEGPDVAQDSAEEQAVAASLHIDAHSFTPSPIEPPAPFSVTAPPEQPLAETPLRRSTRPRKSVAPNLLDVPSPDSRQASPLPGSARKGKRRALSPLLGERDNFLPPLQQNSESAIPEKVDSDVLPAFSRELGSLSPTSNGVLSRLASPERPTAMSSALPPSNLFSQIMQLQFPPSTPSRTLQTISTRLGSPSKVFLTPAARDDPNRTPARRIPAGPTIATGHMQSSPLKGPDHTLVLNPSRSAGPPRRVLDTPIISTSVVRRVASPTRPQVPTRSRSVEPQLPLPILSKSKTRGSSAEPLHLSSATKEGRLAKCSRLPFPLLARAEPISEEPEAGPSQKGATPIQSKVPFTSKSLLKQPSSRIPRIGAKPYARSTATTKAKGNVTQKLDSKVTGTRSKSVTESKPQLTPQVVLPPSKNGVIASVNGIGSSLKRKRETLEPPQSTTKPRPVVVRQAPSLPRTELHSSAGSSKVTASSTSPTVQRVFGKARNAASTIPSEPSTSRPQAFSPPLPSKSLSPPPTRIPSPSTHIPLPSHSIEALLQPTVPIPDTGRPPSPLPTPSNLPTSDVEDDSTSGLTSSTRDRSRRVTRLRKIAITDSDVFRDRPTSSRRKAQTRTSEPEGYGGLSAVALKAMTSTNTTRNQHYLTVTIATEVIKKEGNRPESPVIKIKTTLQKQQDEKERQRQERAARRAKRSGGEVDVESSIEIDGSKVESSVDGESDGEGLVPEGYRRGPGDEEDYQVPEQVSNGSEDSLAAKRRVTWDRGLFTAVYLDEVKLGSRPPPKGDTTLKGCLASACKALQLDLHGNAPNAEVPWADFVLEDVVVKRFLYDSDVEPVEEAPPVKNTRSRTKKQNR